MGTSGKNAPGYENPWLILWQILGTIMGGSLIGLALTGGF
ncbi:hypothetical protein LCGC14_2625690 [marine sediment metagenome]|uniref:Uncharacterized protein n=1 Tax=marine sediment metagenome TaxID=412755 RepID=A0A0F9A1U7_9ZZZZ